MLPFLDLGIVQIPMYGLCVAVGLFLAVFVAWRILLHAEGNRFWDFTIVASVVIGCAFVCAKLLYLVVTYSGEELIAALLSLFLPESSQAKAGFVFYGGLIGGVAGLFLGTKIAGARLSVFLDVFAVIVPLAHAFGRVGCFCAGCCYGIPCDGVFAVKYYHPISSVPVGVGIFPVQLVEAALLVVLFVVLLVLFLNGKRLLWCIYFCAYGTMRFFLEFFRFDYERGFLGWFSVSQVISVFVILLSVCVTLCVLFKRCRQYDSR